MNEDIQKDEIDKALIDAYSDVHVSDELKAATMARIAKMRAQQEAEESLEPVHSVIIEMGPKRKIKRRIFAIAASITLCLVLAFGTGNVLINTETAYAEVNSAKYNAPITFCVNRFDNVISIKTDNADLQETINSLALKGMNYEDAIQALANSGCLGEESIDITIGGNNTVQKEKMINGTVNCLENSGHSGECNGQGFGNGSGANNGNGSSNNNGNGSGNGANNGSNQGKGTHHNGVHE